MIGSEFSVLVQNFIIRIDKDDLNQKRSILTQI